MNDRDELIEADSVSVAMQLVHFSSVVAPNLDVYEQTIYVHLYSRSHARELTRLHYL